MPFFDMPLIFLTKEINKPYVLLLIEYWSKKQNQQQDN